MKKLTFFILSLLFFFCQTDSLIAQLGCPLPAPQNVHITTVTPTSLFVAWNSVPGAVSYKISVYDQTDMVALPDVFSTSPSVELADLSTATHEYQIGVSASACANGPYGAAATTNYKPGIIIIVDVIVQASNPIFSRPFGTPGSNPESVPLPDNYNRTGNLDVKHIRVNYGIGSDVPYVEFLVWSDCNRQTRYHQVNQSPNIVRIASENGLTFKLSNGTNFFALQNYATSTSPSIQYSDMSQCKVASNDWTVHNDDYSCGQGDKSRSQRQQEVTPAPTYGQTAFEVSPNPFSDRVRIRYETETPQQVGIDLVNATGVTVENLYPLEWTEKGAHELYLPVSVHLPAGVYFLIIRTDTERRVIPVIKE